MIAIDRPVSFSLAHPKRVLALAAVVTLLLASSFSRIRVDTDPENMLETTQLDRARYDRMKLEFGLHEMIVVGILDPEGIYRPEALARIARVVERIVAIEGVIAEDVVSLTTTSHATLEGGSVRIGPVMEAVPAGERDLAGLRRTVSASRFLDGKIVSHDGRAAAVYVPIRSKDQSRRIAREIQGILDAELLRGQTAHVAGLPVAEDTFGHEMFVQMAVVAPLAFAGILILVYALFRDASLLPIVGVTAALSVVWTMGTLVATGQTVHIMSSMIPVFLMPIAILDEVHVLSDYHERFRATGDRLGSFREAMRALYRPMLFTSITTAVGFASLALSPIPPVRVFGLFVALGVGVAWLLTHTVAPAVFALGAGSFPVSRAARSRSRIAAAAHVLSEAARRHPGPVLLVGAAGLVLGAAGIAKLRVDDNPVRWFRPGHPVRLADDAMNERFGGTYMAYLLVEGDEPGAMHLPEVVRYAERLQRRLEADAAVGTTTSVADIVRRIHRVLHAEDPAFDRIPDSAEEVGQLLFLFQGSAQPGELDNFVDREARQAAIWVQMTTGENRRMEQVEDAVAAFARSDPPPAGIRLTWSGLNHINRVWQELMVTGMLRAVLGSFLVVLVLILLEFRSWRIALLSMAPLMVAVVLSYGAVGWSGKSYDMPIAVCSALSLGLAIDFAIHFFERYRSRWRATGNLQDAGRFMSGLPAHAIARNALVISLGFAPLALSSLTPYLTVSLFFASLMLTSALATLLLLPAAVRVLGPRVFG